MLRKPGAERLEPPDGAADPAGQRRAIELDTMLRENLALAVKRQVIAVLGGQDMSEQGRAGILLNAVGSQGCEKPIDFVD